MLSNQKKNTIFKWNAPVAYLRNFNMNWNRFSLMLVCNVCLLFFLSRSAMVYVATIQQCAIVVGPRCISALVAPVFKALAWLYFFFFHAARHATHWHTHILFCHSIEVVILLCILQPHVHICIRNSPSIVDTCQLNLLHGARIRYWPYWSIVLSLQLIYEMRVSV